MREDVEPQVGVSWMPSSDVRETKAQIWGGGGGMFACSQQRDRAARSRADIGGMEDMGGGAPGAGTLEDP